MADDPLHDPDTACGEPPAISAETELKRERSGGGRLARSLLWTLTSALIVFTAALAWAVTLAGGGWYLLLAAACLLVPLPLWYLLTDRRQRTDA